MFITQIRDHVNSSMSLKNLIAFTATDSLQSKDFEWQLV